MLSVHKSAFSQAKILIVDDRADNLKILSRMLAIKGYEIEESDRGRSAIELAQAGPPDLILLDVNMPEMDGFEVCQVLKNNNITKDIPIIFISALREIENKTQAFEIGGDDYITKPFDMKEVFLRVENQLKKYRLESELRAKNNLLHLEKRELLETEDKLLSLIENIIT